MGAGIFIPPGLDVPAAVREYQCFRNGATISTQIGGHPVVRQDKADAMRDALIERLVEAEAALAEQTAVLQAIHDNPLGNVEELQAALAEREAGCCANCATCTPTGFCKHPEALDSVGVHYPMQSDFRCRYWTARAEKGREND